VLNGYQSQSSSDPDNELFAIKLVHDIPFILCIILYFVLLIIEHYSSVNHPSFLIMPLAPKRVNKSLGVQKWGKIRREKGP
jgi:hypothetical protein